MLREQPLADTAVERRLSGSAKDRARGKPGDSYRKALELLTGKSRGEKKARTVYGLFHERVSDDVLLSRARAHYHRRKSVSRSCSGWEGVVPLRYGRQTKLVGGEPSELPRLAAVV